MNKIELTQYDYLVQISINEYKNNHPNEDPIQGIICQCFSDEIKKDILNSIQKFRDLKLNLLTS